MADFDTSLQKVLANEGGYRFVSWDPGGETYQGISRVYNPTWPGWVAIDKIKAETGTISTGKMFPELWPLVKNFYQTFWNSISGDAINNQSLADLIFDFYIQSGYAVKEIQKAINGLISPNSIATDNNLGSITLGFINSLNPSKLNNAILDQRLSYYTSLLNQGIISPNDWQGILNRLKQFPYLKEISYAAALLTVAAMGFYIYRLSKANEK